MTKPVAPDAYRAYYERFLLNSRDGRWWKLKLVGTREPFIGIPRASSIVNVLDPSFELTCKDRSYTVHFRLLTSAEPLPKAPDAD